MSRSISIPFSRRHRVFHGHKVGNLPRACPTPNKKAAHLFVQERSLLAAVTLLEAVVVTHSTPLMTNDTNH